MAFKQKIELGDEDIAGGLECHVLGWDISVFFKIMHVDDRTAHLSTRYSRVIKYRVDRNRVYLTRRSRKLLMQRRAEKKGQVAP